MKIMCVSSIACYFSEQKWVAIISLSKFWVQSYFKTKVYISNSSYFILKFSYWVFPFIHDK